MTVGELIRTKRQEQRKSMRAVATDAGITASFLSDIEKGKRNPSEPVRKRLALALSLADKDLEELDYNVILRKLEHILQSKPETREPLKRLAELLSERPTKVLAQLSEIVGR